MRREIIKTVNAPAAIGPYSQGVISSDLVFCAGQLPLDPATGTLVEGGFLDEVRKVIENIAAILEAGNSCLDKVVRLDVYLTDLDLFHEVNACLKEVFQDEPPARVTIGISALPMGARIEMAAIATT